MTALLLLAGCLGAEDLDDAEEEEIIEDVVEDVLEIEGCGDETSLTYVANVTNSSNELCVYEDTLETTIVDFITLIENGPDMETLDSTVGYSMELSEVYVDMDDCYEWEYWNPELVDESQPYNGCPDVVEENIHYLETIIVSPTGYKATMEHSIDGVTEYAEIILSGNEFQYTTSNSTEDYTARMKHAGTYEEAMAAMMSDGEDDDMGSDDDEMVCYDIDTHMIQYEYIDQMNCEAEGYMWVPADSGPNNGEDDDMGSDDSEPDASDYTQYFNPLSATITDYAPDETGYTFSGMLNIDDAPFSYLEIHTDSSFTVLGFTMEDTEEEDNWVEFMMISSGDTSTDETIALSALPYILFDMSEMSGDDDGDDDWEYMGPYFYENCDDAEGLSSYDCWDNEWDIDGDGIPEDSDSYWNYECQQHSNGTWECMTDHINYYDRCEQDDHPSYYECWLNEWDTDNNGWYDLGSDDYDRDECELLDDGRWACVGHEDEIEMYQNYDHCSDETGNHECWMDDWVDSEGNIVMTDGYELGDCIELENGTWDCLLVDEPEEEFHYYDNCTDEGDHYECWMDEWDYDNDGDYEESHGYNYSDCSEDESNGSWMCFAGYADEDNEDVMYYYYDDCNYDDVEDDYLCSVPEGVEVWSNCELESNGTWKCWHDYDYEFEDLYYCVPFVEHNSAGFSIFDNTSLDDSMCGMEVTEDMYDFDNSTFTMPIHLTYEDCWMEDNETVCETGDIYYDVNTTMLWENAHENNYMDCDGYYDNNTSICTEWLGNITQADGGAFLLVNDYDESLMMYQYDESTQSGLIIVVMSSDDDDDDMDLNATFAYLDADEDGEITISEWADMINQSDGEMSEDEFNAFAMMFDMHDEDNSSGLNFDEFVNMIEAMNNDDGDMDPEMMFNMLDANGDGEVTASEWADWSNTTEDPMPAEDFEFFASMMDNYDNDESGGLDFDEFMTFIEELENMEDGDGFGEDIKMFMAFGATPFLGADLNDYMVKLAMCDGTSLADLVCDDAIYSVALADIMYNSEEAAMMAMMTEAMVFVDADDSGTLSNGDYLMVNNATVDGEWNFARLYSNEAGAYSDENPMMSMLPGFTGFIATIGLLGAALIRRE
jgi:Ca2+-binding EF-hand superfamily protein